MIDSKYTEDVFLSLSDLVISNMISYQPQDYKPLMSFRTILKNNDQLTAKQGNFVLILLGKYKKQLEQIHEMDFDVDKLQWRSPFREIDYSKSLTIENNDEGYPCAVLKFPFNIKDSFDKTFGGAFPYHPITKTRHVPLLSVNPVELLDFCVQNNFSIDNEFVDYVNSVEEVWAHEESLAPFSIVKNGEVALLNAIESTQNYFNKNKHNVIEKDMFLARMLGFPLITAEQDPFSKLCSTIDTTQFRTDNMDTLADILAKLELDNVVIVLDRQSNVTEFISNLIDSLEKKCYNTNKIRVCFRGANNTQEGKEFNNWIKMNNLGGKVIDGNIFIFKHTIAKWAKKIENAPQLAISNFIYEPTNVSTRNFLKSCHATITVSETPPTTRKENTIVNM